MKIQVRDRQVQIVIKKSVRARYLRATFARDYSEIKITQPRSCTRLELKQFIETRVKDWANKNDKFIEQVNLLELPELPILGNAVKLRFIHDLRNYVSYNDDIITINYRQKDDRQYLLKQILFDTAAEYFTKWCQEYADILAVHYSKLSVKDMTSRWGSCSKSNRTINLSVRLIFAPEAVAKYVCAHEVVHLIHANHNQAFWDVVKQLDANYNERRKWLKDNGNILQSFNLV